VKVNAYFYDASNQLLVSDYGYACLNAMGPGEVSPFTVLLLNPPGGVDHVTVQVASYYQPPLLYRVPPGLSVDSLDFYLDGLGFLHASGEVTNYWSNTHESVKVCGAFYDASGDVIDTDFAYVDPDNLSPNQTGTYDIWSIVDPAFIESATVWADASYP
jgi:hypothetical protein